jgi:hypothetical protein
MKLSWMIQRNKKSDRAKALRAAWAIILNEDVTVFHLVKKHSHQNNPNRVNTHDLSLFN